MSRVLLVDDSPHAQRMGERILTEEGYEVVTVSNAESALVRLEDVDPDVVLADTVMPGRTGFEICQYLKMNPKHKHVRVILTAGVLEPLDESHTQRVEADGILRKPFEASGLLAAVKPLAEAAARERQSQPSGDTANQTKKTTAAPAAPFVAVVDAEQVRAAVTMALDAAMGQMVDEITARVVAALNSAKKLPVPTPKAAEPPVLTVPPPVVQHAPIAPPVAAEPVRPIAPREASGRIEPVRRVSPLRLRSGSILGIEINRPEKGDDLPSGSPPPSDPHP